MTKQHPCECCDFGHQHRGDTWWADCMGFAVNSTFWERCPVPSKRKEGYKNKGHVYSGHILTDSAVTVPMAGGGKEEKHGSKETGKKG